MTDCTSVLLHIKQKKEQKNGAFDRSYSRIKIRKNFVTNLFQRNFSTTKQMMSWVYSLYFVLFRKTVDRTRLKLRKNGQQRATCFAILQEKQLEKRCCAFYHPRSKLLTTWFVARQVLRGSRNIAIQLSLQPMLQDRLHGFCCQFYSLQFSNQSRLPHEFEPLS